MKIFKSLQFFIYFSTVFNNFATFGWGGAGYRPQPPTNTYFPNFLNFSLNSRENFDKLLKNFQKSQNFL